MNIQQKHIQSQKRIGSLGGSPVVEVVTTGGFHMVVTKKGGELLTLGTGPHRSVARHIAKKREPDLFIEEMSKSDHVDVASIESIAPRYEQYTDFCNAVAHELVKHIVIE